jgi:hypothetical protein
MTPKSQEVTETTGLINENYYDSMEVQADSSSCQSDDDDHDTTNQQAFSRNCKRFIFAYKRTIFMILLGIGLLSASMLGLMTFRTKSTSSSSSSSSSSKNDSDSGDDGDTMVPTDGRPFPLSLLDPIHDLGLAGWDRSPDESSFPSFYYNADADADDRYGNNNSRKLSASESSNNNNTTSRKKKALPTNAWYQNMLQVSHNDEPTNLQRTYPVPYLVDVVGLIPGLRMHATDIDASDMVMQLSFNENAGLVLGATEHLSSKKKTIHSHRYKVLKTTNLGITLEWVRNISNKQKIIVRTVSIVFLFFF